MRLRAPKNRPSKPQVHLPFQRQERPGTLSAEPPPQGKQMVRGLRRTGCLGAQLLHRCERWREVGLDAVGTEINVEEIHGTQ